MNLQQLEYIVALDDTRHFVKASEKCFVTQPTLSMMVQKLEEELGVKIFDRSKHPLIPTEEGAVLLEMARKIVQQSRSMKDYVQLRKNEFAGELRIGIIPTLAPYLLPRFLSHFTDACPDLQCNVKEMTTEMIIEALLKDRIDVGIAATPFQHEELQELPLFYEEFVAYASKEEKFSSKRYLAPKEIRMHRLWLLEEGHCFRNQILNLCQLKKAEQHQIHYEAGSIETLIRMVDLQNGLTLIPKLAELQLHEKQKKKVREFAAPTPVREISLVTNKNYIRKGLLDRLKQSIQLTLPPELQACLLKPKGSVQLRIEKK